MAEQGRRHARIENDRIDPGLGPVRVEPRCRPLSRPLPYRSGILEVLEVPCAMPGVIALHAPAFAALFPQVRLDPDVLFVDDGDVLTSAGNAAGIDLLLHVVRRDHGSEVASRVARRSVVAPWRDGGQSQFIERPVPEPGDVGTAATRAWALEHLGDPLTLADLAAHARMSVRTFTRRFREETGLSASRWLVQQRVALARRLLESTDVPVERVAERAGFGTTASLRQHLNAAIGVAPLAYRRTYRGPVAHPM